MERYQWSKSYGEAMRESRRETRMVRINTALNQLLRSLFQTAGDAGRREEEEETLCALSDLLALIHLHKKYA